MCTRPCPQAGGIPSLAHPSGRAAGALQSAPSGSVVTPAQSVTDSLEEPAGGGMTRHPGGRTSDGPAGTSQEGAVRWSGMARQKRWSGAATRALHQLHPSGLGDPWLGGLRMPVPSADRSPRQAARRRWAVGPARRCWTARSSQQGCPVSLKRPIPVPDPVIQASVSVPWEAVREAIRYETEPGGSAGPGQPGQPAVGSARLAPASGPTSAIPAGVSSR